jgi:hypothetical protein
MIVDDSYDEGHHKLMVDSSPTENSLSDRKIFSVRALAIKELPVTTAFLNGITKS